MPTECDSEKRSRRRRVGELLLEEGLVTRPELDDALRTQEANPGTLLGQVLVERGVLTQQQLATVLDKYKKKYRLGDLLVETNAITEEQLETALQQQRETGLRLGDVLVQLNYLSELELKRALCTQLRIRLVDPDEMIADSALAGLVDARYARQHRVVPVGRTADRLTLAMEDPTDLAVVDALEATTGLAIDVVTAPAAAFDQALARLYGPDRSGAPAPEPQPPAVGPAVGVLEARYAEAVRQLTALQAAQARLSRELELSVRARAEAESRHTETTAQLAALRSRYAVLATEHDSTAQALRDLRERYRAVERGRQRSTDPLAEILRGLRP